MALSRDSIFRSKQNHPYPILLSHACGVAGFKKATREEEPRVSESQDFASPHQPSPWLTLRGAMGGGIDSIFLLK